MDGEVQTSERSECPTFYLISTPRNNTTSPTSCLVSILSITVGFKGDNITSLGR